MRCALSTTRAERYDTFYRAFAAADEPGGVPACAIVAVSDAR
jgi:hypothetical protein